MVAYVDGGLEGCSYPDLIEDRQAFFICATQKTEARVMPVDAALLDGLWRQDSLDTVTSNGLILDLSNPVGSRHVGIPIAPQRAGIPMHRDPTGNKF